MNKLLLAAGLVVILNACGEHKESHSEHVTQDSGGHMTHTSAADSSNKMKALMDGMMMKMHQQQPTGNVDLDYAYMMLQHHQGAVDMAKLQLDKGSNATLKEFSKKVIADQEKEIGMMATFISKAGNTASVSAAAFKAAMDSSMQTMMMSEAKIYQDTDKDFVAQMIPHHQSAVDMAKAYLQYGTEPTLKKMSDDIIASQTKEIDWLKEWLTKNG